MLQTCKPDPVLSSVALAKEDKLSFICPANCLPGSICLPCPASSRWPESNEQLFSGTMRGISACKVYPQMMLPSKAVGSYPTFSSFPRKRGSYFLWHYLLLQLTFQHWLKYPAIHRCIALYCPDFPPQLEASKR